MHSPDPTLEIGTLCNKPADHANIIIRYGNRTNTSCVAVELSPTAPRKQQNIEFCHVMNLMLGVHH